MAALSCASDGTEAPGSQAQARSQVPRPWWARRRKALGCCSRIDAAVRGGCAAAALGAERSLPLTSRLEPALGLYIIMGLGVTLSLLVDPAEISPSARRLRAAAIIRQQSSTKR